MYGRIGGQELKKWYRIWFFYLLALAACNNRIIKAQLILIHGSFGQLYSVCQSVRTLWQWKCLCLINCVSVSPMRIWVSFPISMLYFNTISRIMAPLQQFSVRIRGENISICFFNIDFLTKTKNPLNQLLIWVLVNSWKAPLPLQTPHSH